MPSNWQFSFFKRSKQDIFYLLSCETRYTRTCLTRPSKTSSLSSGHLCDVIIYLNLPTCDMPVRKHMVVPRHRLSVSRQLLRSHYKLPGPTQNRHLKQTSMPGEQPPGTDYTLFLRHLIFFGVWINFSSLCSRLSEAPWFHWSTVQRTVISIWQELTGYTQLLCLWLRYDDTDSYLDCPLSYQLSLSLTFWMLGKSAKAHTTPGSFGF